VGELMERYGGGGHIAVGGANPHDLEATRQVAGEVADQLEAHLVAHGEA
jgi:nanoRNase/pAp phosphatase (c-di-AMP/oligoRNAs hydrolase)